jgi:hypothetical protein
MAAIGRFSASHGYEECLVKSDANGWLGRMQMGGQVSAITHLESTVRYNSLSSEAVERPHSRSAFFCKACLSAAAPHAPEIYL